MQYNVIRNIVTHYEETTNKHILHTLSLYYKNKPNIIFGTKEYAENILLESLDGSYIIAHPVLTEIKNNIYETDKYEVFEKLHNNVMSALKQNDNSDVLYFFLCHTNNNYINVILDYARSCYVVTQKFLIATHRIQYNG